MSDGILESDWRKFRVFRQNALERFCKYIFEEIEHIGADTEKNVHQRYLDAYCFIHDRDRDIGIMFNDPRRSRALDQITEIRKRGLFTEDEYLQFSDDTRECVDRYAKLD